MASNMPTLWFWYRVFFHFNPAGFIFLHAFILVPVAATLHERRWRKKQRGW